MYPYLCASESYSYLVFKLLAVVGLASVGMTGLILVAMGLVAASRKGEKVDE